MIVWIASFPRSGNTLYRIAIHQLTGLPTYAAVEDPLFNGEPMLLEAMGHVTLPHGARLPSRQEIRRGVAKRTHPFLNDDEVHFVKTHARAHELPYEAPAVYIVRDGRDALVSFAHYQLTAKWGKTPERFKPRLLRIVQNCRWGEHVIGWLPKAAEVIRYEDMVADPIGVVAESIETLGLDVAINRDAEIPTFEELCAKSRRFFRRGHVGGYADEMPKYIETEFWELHGNGMIAAGYEG